VVKVYKCLKQREVKTEHSCVKQQIENNILLTKQFFTFCGLQRNCLQGEFFL